MKKFFLLSFIFIATESCTQAPKKPVKPPAPVVVREFPVLKLRPVRDFTLENGLKILFIRDSSLPRVSFTLLSRVGVREEAKSGLNAFTAQLLEMGSSQHNALQLADEFAKLGTDFSAAPGPDYTVFSTDSLSLNAEKALNLFSEVLTTPLFEEKEVQRMRAQIVASLKKRLDNPNAVVEERYQNFIFEGHPYSHLVLGDIASVQKVRKQDIIKHYLNWYRPNNSALAVVGSFNENFEKKVMETFKAWPIRELKKITTMVLPDLQSTEVLAYTAKNLAQTQIRIGQRGVPRNTEDFLKLRLAFEILGGGFSSRLNQKVRDELGLTYSINSSLDARADRGAFTISTFTKNEAVAATLGETLRVFQEFAANGVTEVELKSAKSLLSGQFPRTFETPDRYASTLLLLDFYGVPRSYVTDFLRNIDRISLTQINEIIRKYFSPQNLRIVIYGEEKSLPQQLKEYKAKIVPVSK